RQADRLGPRPRGGHRPGTPGSGLLRHRGSEDHHTAASAHPGRDRLHRRAPLDPLHGALRRLGVGCVRLRLPPVYAITGDAGGAASDAAKLSRRLFAVGVRCLQLREKSAPDRDLLAAADAIGASAREHGALFFVNDRVDVARLAGAGVHLGEEDLPAGAARAVLGPDRAIGVSTHDLAAARRAFADDEVDYVAFGPVFESATKTGRPALRLDT